MSQLMLGKPSCERNKPRRLILTALNDDHDFWFNNLIPFLISLEHTDYTGDIGVLSYGLSKRKKSILLENNILVFEAPYFYQSIYIDRQWAAAQIAEQYSYDELALYDTDIWFPSDKLTVFNQIQDLEKLYCAYDVSYADFINKSVRQPTRELIQPKIGDVLAKHKYLWQVGLLLGTKMAWKNYQDYLGVLLNNPDYVIGYGIDSLAIVLYSAERDNVEPISQKYNCLPSCGGLKISNLYNGMVLDKEIITFNNELVEGLHLVTQFRSFGMSVYTHSFWNVDFFNESKKYRINKSEDIEYTVHIEDRGIDETKNSPLKITYLKSDAVPKIDTIEDDTIVTLGAESVFVLQNTSDIPFELQCAIQPLINYRKPSILAILCNNQTTMLKDNLWSVFTIQPNDYIQFISRDTDNEKVRTSWRLHRTRLIS